jgi:hypothetical protein
MNTAIAAIEEDINGAAPRNVVFSDTERIGVSHEEFRSTGDVVTVFDRAGCLDGTAVVAAGA